MRPKCDMKDSLHKMISNNFSIWSNRTCDLTLRPIKSKHFLSIGFFVKCFIFFNLCACVKNFTRSLVFFLPLVLQQLLATEQFLQLFQFCCHFIKSSRKRWPWVQDACFYKVLLKIICLADRDFLNIVMLVQIQMLYNFKHSNAWNS